MINENIVQLYKSPKGDEYDNFYLLTDHGLYMIWPGGGFDKEDKAVLNSLVPYNAYPLSGMFVSEIKFDALTAVLKFTNGDYLRISIDADLDSEGQRTLDTDYIKAIDAKKDAEFMDYFINELEE